MGTFREFELAAWENPATCGAYQDRLGVVVAQSIEPLLDAARVTGADRVVDVATGSGVVAAAAVRRGAVVTGLDFSAEQLRRARAAQPLVAFARADAGALPLAASSVDVVASNFGMPHFPDPEAFLRESARVLRPAGRLAFTVWAPPPRSPTFAAVLGALGAARDARRRPAAPARTSSATPTRRSRPRTSPPPGSSTCRSPMSPRPGSFRPRTTPSTPSCTAPSAPRPCSPGNPPAYWTRSGARRGNSWRRTTRATLSVPMPAVVVRATRP